MESRISISATQALEAQPKLDLASHTLVKIGTNQLTLVGPEVTGGNIVVNGGTLATEAGIQLKDGATPGGNGTIFFNGNNTVFQFFNVTDVNSITRPVVINGTGVRTGNNSSTNSLVGSSFLLHNNLEVTQIGSTGTSRWRAISSKTQPRAHRQDRQRIDHVLRLQHILWRPEPEPGHVHHRQRAP